MFYLAWFAWAVFVLSVASLVMPPTMRRLRGLADALFGPPRFKISPHEETEWGTMFAIVDPKGEIVGLDRYVVAKARCDELNSGHKD
jgi:hypothetical protein